jgi:ribosomal protein S18 acetylase RimI-like enzyme
MRELEIRPFSVADDEAAVALEAACVQGRSLALRFRRPSFAARSSVYDDAALLGGWLGDRLVGTVAAACKPVELRGRPLRATYFYDLRVHPDCRGRGYAHRLMKASRADMGAEAECHYVLVAGQNRAMLGLLESNYRYSKEASIPLTYVCLPVFRRRAARPAERVNPDTVRARHVDATQATFLPSYLPGRMRGFVARFAIAGAGCSVWTNADLLAGEVVRLPLPLRALARLRPALRPLVRLPEVPRPGEMVRSWFLYDLYADSADALRRLLDAVNDAALEQDRVVLYLLLQDTDPLLEWTRAARRLAFTFPYRLLARGSRVPHRDDRVYLDVRDL